MSNPLTDTPESPPAPPVIPVGLATKLGTIFAVLAAVAAAVTPLLEGDQTPTTIALILAALGAVYKVMDGRYNQATAVYQEAPAATGIIDYPPPEPSDEEVALGEGGEHPDGDYNAEDFGEPEGGLRKPSLLQHNGEQ